MTPQTCVFLENRVKVGDAFKNDSRLGSFLVESSPIVAEAEIETFFEARFNSGTILKLMLPMVAGFGKKCFGVSQPRNFSNNLYKCKTHGRGQWL